MPVVPATGQLLGTTGADGSATFSGLSPGEHTVTIVRSGYDLVTLYGTLAANVSLPLRPIANATATLQGTATFAPSPGTTVVVGSLEGHLDTAPRGGNGFGYHLILAV